MQVVISDAVQLELQVVKVFCAHTCSVDVTLHVVMHSLIGLNTQEEEAERKMPPHLSNAFACARAGASENPNKQTDALKAVRIRAFMVKSSIGKWRLGVRRQRT